MTYTVKHTTLYRGGHAADPGYRVTVVVTAKGDREYTFVSHPNGSNARRVETRPTQPTTPRCFRQLADRHAFAKAPALEAAIKAYLASAHAEAICADCGGTFWRKGTTGTPLCRHCGVLRMYPGDPEAAKAAMDRELAQVIDAVFPFSIAFVGFGSPTECPLQVTDGYNAHDYLPGFDERRFSTYIQADDWMTANHKGPDVDGVTALFIIVEDE